MENETIIMVTIHIKKLTNAACYYGYNFDELAHDSLEDVKATLVVYNALKKKLPSYVWM